MPAAMPQPAIVPPLPTMPVTCRLLNMVSFTEGNRNGRDFDESTIDEIVSNFNKFNRGYWLPYVTVNHEESTGPNPNAPTVWDGLSLGDVVDCRKVMVDGKAGFEFDCVNVPTPIGQLVNSRQLRAVSVEWFDPELSPFIGPDDQPVMSKVLKCVTLVGAAPEAAKGMPQPVATFTDRPIRKPPVRKFNQTANPKESRMDRQGILTALKSFGVNVDSITDAVPDDTLKSILDAMQALTNQDPSQMRQKMSDHQEPDADDVTRMSQGGAGAAPAAAIAAPAAAPAAVAPVAGGLAGGQNPQSITLKFRDTVIPVRVDAGTGVALQTLFTHTDREFKQMQDALAVIQQGEKNRTKAMRDQAIAAFRDEMVTIKNGVAAMTPVQFDSIRPMLEQCDVLAVRKFADGKTTGTALDEQMATIRNSFKPTRRFGDELPDPLRTGANGAAAVDPAQRAKLLSMTPEGKEVLKREAALAGKK